MADLYHHLLLKFSLSDSPTLKAEMGSGIGLLDHDSPPLYEVLGGIRSATSYPPRKEITTKVTGN